MGQEFADELAKLLAGEGPVDLGRAGVLEMQVQDAHDAVADHEAQDERERERRGEGEAFEEPAGLAFEEARAAGGTFRRRLGDTVLVVEDHQHQRDVDRREGLGARADQRQHQAGDDGRAHVRLLLHQQEQERQEGQEEISRHDQAAAARVLPDLLQDRIRDEGAGGHRVEEDPLPLAAQIVPERRKSRRRQHQKTSRQILVNERHILPKGENFLPQHRAPAQLLQPDRPVDVPAGRQVIRPDRAVQHREPEGPEREEEQRHPECLAARDIFVKIPECLAHE